MAPRTLKTGGKKPTASEITELGEAVRDIALDQLAGGLRRLGVSEEAIAEARAECVAQNSDKPLLNLLRGKR